MRRRSPRATRTGTLFPDSTLFRSALDPFGRRGLELLDDLIDRRLLVAEIGALLECAAGREQCECRDSEPGGSGFHDDGLHDSLRWAGGSAIAAAWMKAHTAVRAGTRALAIRHSTSFPALPNGGPRRFWSSLRARALMGRV